MMRRVDAGLDPDRRLRGDPRAPGLSDTELGAATNARFPQPTTEGLHRRRHDHRRREDRRVGLPEVIRESRHTKGPDRICSRGLFYGES